MNNPDMPVRIKICGVTRPEDAALAARLGAHAVGMVFYPAAKRCVSLDTAREILAALPPFVTPVGLFVDQPVDQILETAHALGLSTLQLHGHESPETVAALRPFSILKALRTDPNTLPAELDEWRNAIPLLQLTNLKALIMETAAPPTAAPGGTGIANDFDYLASLQAAGQFANLPPLIAAGGLRPDSVAQVVQKLHPYAVDVSSGVEANFGQKSPEKISQFIANALNAE